MLTTITARSTVAGLHHWPDAPARRAYLRNPHRHLFVVSAEVRVAHGDRDVEYHDLGDRVQAELLMLAQAYPGTALLDFGARSCESIALSVLEGLQEEGYDVVQVTVSEDGEHDSTVRA